MGTGPALAGRRKFDQSQKIVMVQDFNCVQMRVSGFNSNNEIVLHAGAKAKTVTSNLPLLSVLGLDFFPVTV